MNLPKTVKLGAGSFLPSKNLYRKCDLSPLPMFSNNQPSFLQKTRPLYPNPKYFFGIVWDLNLGHKELGI